MELHADVGAGALEACDRLTGPAFVYAMSLLAIDPNGQRCRQCNAPQRDRIEPHLCDSLGVAADADGYDAGAC